MITIEKLKEELASVQRQITQTAANLNALAGAEQILQNLINSETEELKRSKEKKPKQAEA